MNEATRFPQLSPLRYEPAFESPEDDEAETTQQIIDTMRKIATTVHQDEGHAFRSVHAKSHGLLSGTLTVEGSLPPELAQGLFAQPATYPVVLRLSTVPGDLLDDSVSTPRGLALKVIGVPGERAMAGDGGGNQDFVTVNGPAFNAPTAGKFLKNLKMLAATTDKAEGVKKVLSATLRGAESLVEKMGGKSPTLLAMGGHPETNILGETFYTQVPMLYGPYMAKLSVVPVSAGLTALTKAPIETSGHPNALREAVVRHFGTQGGTWEVRIQLCTDLQAMPIEDASVEWPEAQSPYVTVARIDVPPQPAWSESRAATVDDGMAFSPWHGLAAHRPIGSVMRVRRGAYEAMAQFRSERNAKKVQEPTQLDGALAAS